VLFKKSENPVAPFGVGIIKKGQGRPPAGDYAMWWSSPQDADVASSPCVAHVERSVRALDRIESYVFGTLRFSLGLQPGPDRRPIPPDGVTYSLLGPEDRPILISVDPEKGFGLFFHPELTPVPYRDKLWQEFAEYSEACRATVEARRLPKDPRPRDHSTALEHWEGVRRSLAMHASEVSSLGVIRID
jgi:hypothetical protein